MSELHNYNLVPRSGADPMYSDLNVIPRVQDEEGGEWQTEEYDYDVNQIRTDRLRHRLSRLVTPVCGVCKDLRSWPQAFLFYSG